MRFFPSCLLIFLFAFAALSAQQSDKIPLSHDVYDSWRSIKSRTLSNDGLWALYTIEPQEGDGKLYLVNLETAQKITFARGTKGQFSFDSEFAIFMVKPQHDSLKAAKRRKVKKEEMPIDSLFIVNLNTAQTEKVARVKSYKIPAEGAGWMAYQLEEKMPGSQKDTARDTTTVPEAKSKSKTSKPKKDKENLVLVIRNLATGDTLSHQGITEYLFSKKGTLLAFSSSGKDSLHPAGVYILNLNGNGNLSQGLKKISGGEGEYKQLAVDEAGEQVAFVANKDTGEVKQRVYALYYWQQKADSAIITADSASPEMPDGWSVTEHGKTFFSEDGSKLYFGTAAVPPAAPEDSLLDEEKVRVDVWSWQDDYIQPQQLLNVEKEKKRSYMAVYDPRKKRIVQLARDDMPDIRLAPEANAEVAVGVSDLPYRKLLSYDWPGYKDAYLVDLRTGERQLEKEKTQANVSLSPGGKYLYWFEPATQQWLAHHVKSGKLSNLTRGIDSKFYYELIDQPREPWSYGAAGWTQDDEAFLIYDRYDIWVTDPDGKDDPWSLTNRMGRSQQVRFRLHKLNREVPFLLTFEPLILSGFNEADKSDGYFKIAYGRNNDPELLIRGNYMFNGLQKARNSNRLMYTRSSFQEYPDLWVSHLDFENPEKISETNPQQARYLWGSAEMVAWRSNDGDNMEGLLYKPANFDSATQYPMIVYYYERLSDNLHRHYVPSPSRSVINPSYYTSNGYIVFMPDISYKVGYPGESAYDAIMSGTMSIINRGFVDADKIGLQGQSWGGYQTAYMITRTNMFRAAMAGAPVSNMTSAYGGIRWGSGLSRQFQYEKTQSRIGATLWENPYLYIENSPVFKADRVKTPLLIMHNDNDGAVPWYQGIELFMALRRLESPVWMLNYNRDGHNLTKRANMKDLSIRMQQFFDHYLKNAPMPVWMKEGIRAIEKGKNMGYEVVETEKEPATSIVEE
ncbi:MAG: prolyl oligopeptidase family serine peptidase [Bacteroidia bacterium]